MNLTNRLSSGIAVALCAASVLFICACSRTPATPPGQPPLLSEKQIKAWQESADKGDALAKFDLAKMYRDGEGVPKDLAESVKWYRKSADAGYAKAQHHLALAYYNGEGVTKDLTEASKWFLKASDQGFGKSQDKLGLMYWKGEGVTNNAVEAHKWLELAVASGENKASKALKKLELSMTPQQINEAKKQAASFVPRKLFKKPDNK